MTHKFLWIFFYVFLFWINCSEVLALGTITITSEKELVVKEDELIFISCLISNESSELLEDSLLISSPDDWPVIPAKEIELCIGKKESSVHIFGVKIPPLAPAGDYKISIHFKEGRDPGFISVKILPKLAFNVKLKEIAKCYVADRPINLELICFNKSNCPAPFFLEISGDPCCEMHYDSSHLLLEEQQEHSVMLHLRPRLGIHDDKQFIFIKVFDSETKELLYGDTYTLLFSSFLEEEEDPFIRIPAAFTVLVLGDNQKIVGALEWRGGGMIDPLCERYMDFVFRIPTDSRNVIYGVDERVYLEIGEPDWSVVFGDTLYTLTPLTQRHRYGRGFGFDIENKRMVAGLHYTQNTFDNDYNPKEWGACLGFIPNDRLFTSMNYFYRSLKQKKSSHILSVASEFKVAPWMRLELEGGRNLAEHRLRHDKWAFRLHTDGKIFKDVWFDFEKIYAGRSFHGYYNHLNLLSALVDFPLLARMRANFNLTHFKQGSQSNHDHLNSCDQHLVTKPYQRQYGMNLSYHFLNGNSLTFNGTLLRAWDVGGCEQYNFYQKWGGVSAFVPFKGWNLFAASSWGTQEDYLKKTKGEWIQKYNFTMSKQITDRISGAFFYDGGNTNYYEAASWATSVGGSLSYRYYQNSFAELFLQKVRNKKDHYLFDQVSFKWRHLTCHRHVWEACVQYFHYKAHYPNDFLFLVSCTVPFGLPVSRRKDIGDVSGYVIDVQNNMPVQRALLSVGDKQCLTDSKGKFVFKNVKSGQQSVKMEILPKQIVTAQEKSIEIVVEGGKNNSLFVDVMPSCSISAEIVRCVYQDTVYLFMNTGQQIENLEILESYPVRGIECVISCAEEVYSTFSDERGRITFSNLRPGKWKISVRSEGLPEFHYLNYNDIIMDLKSEDHKEVYFKVLPVVRTIQPLNR